MVCLFSPVTEFPRALVWRRENNAGSGKRCMEQDVLVALDIIERHKKDIKKRQERGKRRH